MEVILSRKEYEFVIDLIELIKKYGILFCVNEQNRISVSLREGHLDRNEFLNPYLDLGDCCDEDELYEILEQSDKRLLQIAAGYKAEELQALKEANPEEALKISEEVKASKEIKASKEVKASKKSKASKTTVE